MLLDLGALADKHGFAALGGFSVSEDHSLLAYTIDFGGAEEDELHVNEASSGRAVTRLSRVLNVEWAAGKELIYTRLDERGRPFYAAIHSAGGSIGGDAVVYEEPNEAAVVDVSVTKRRGFVTINSNVDRCGCFFYRNKFPNISIQFMKW